MEKIKGEVLQVEVETFINKQNSGIVVWRSGYWVDREGIIPVTLSPIGQEPGTDHEAMWNELFNRDDASLALRDVMKEIKARHEGTKPEGKDEKTQT